LREAALNDPDDDEMLKAFEEGKRKRRGLLSERIAAAETGRVVFHSDPDDPTRDTTSADLAADRAELERLSAEHARRKESRS
jgi:hypothetical protein